MIKVMEVVGLEGNPSYLANGEYVTEVQKGEVKLVTYSKKGKLVIYKNGKVSWVTISKEDFENCYEVVNVNYFGSYRTRGIEFLSKGLI